MQFLVSHLEGILDVFRLVDGTNSYTFYVSPTFEELQVTALTSRPPPHLGRWSSHDIFCFCPSGPYAVLTKDTMPQTYKRKRSWSRAVFSNLQRKGLEKRFEVQKYVTKPDRKQLAAMLGLTDAQVR